MRKRYNDLTEEQINNVFFFLDKVQKHHLSTLINKYQLKHGKNLIETRQNVIDALMMQHIDFEYFSQWLSHIDLEGNNSLFVFEADNDNLWAHKTLKKITDKL